MRFLLPIGVLCFASAVYAQPAQVQVNADCVIAFNISTSGGTVPSTGGFNNTSIGCNSWQISYANNGFSAVTLAVQSAPNTSGNVNVCTPGSWGTIGGTLTFGVNPNTNTTGASSLIQSYGTNFAACVRVALTSATGAGNVTGVLLGYRAAGSAGTSGGGGATSNVNVSQYGGNNVASGGVNGAFAVAGTASSGSLTSGNPVRIAGTDAGGVVRQLLADSNGGLSQSGQANAFTDGVANAQNTFSVEAGGSLGQAVQPAFNYSFNGSTWDRSFVCTSQAEVSLSGTGYTQIIALSGSTVIRLCKVFVTSSSGGNPVVNTFTLAYGTGSNCASGTTELMNAAGITGMDEDFLGALRSASGNAFCVKEATANSDKVSVTYAQY